MYNSFRLSSFHADKILISDSPPRPTKYLIPALKLTNNDKMILLNGDALTDKHMDACLNVLSEQFPDMPDPQTSVLAQLPGSLKAAQEKSKFFHNFSGHWAMSHLSSGIIFLFDSLLPKELDLTLREQMLSLYGKRPVQRPCVQHQNGSKDCGCFAIAFCVSVLYGEDPSSLVFNQKEMRGHIIRCLKQDSFLPFPGVTKKAKCIVPPLELSLD